MKALDVIQQAIADLYHTEILARAGDYLVDTLPPHTTEVASHRADGCEDFRGALLVDYRDDDGDGESEIHLGIFLSEELKRALAALDLDNADAWSARDVSAFAVAAEEVSHFQYLLFHGCAGRGVSQLELETQGDIDKFLLLHFTGATSSFDETFARVFENFSLSRRLDRGQIERYLEANRIARRCIHKMRDGLSHREKLDATLKTLRRLYRLSLAEKLSATL